jgi:hypothetical protein
MFEPDRMGIEGSSDGHKPGGMAKDGPMAHRSVEFLMMGYQCQGKGGLSGWIDERLSNQTNEDGGRIIRA